MIALLAGYMLAAVQVVELVNPSAREISIQAVVRLPQLGAKDLSKLEIIAGAIPKQTEEYSRREMLMVTNGQTVRCNLTPDHFRIVFSVAPDNLKTGLSLMDSLIRKATLNQENLDIAAAEIEEPTYWSAALNPTIRANVKLGTEEAKALYKRVIRPNRVFLFVGGKFEAGSAQEIWETRLESWNPGQEPRGYFDISPVQDRVRSPGSVATIDFAGAPLAGNDVFLPTKILALFALGSGKGASLFRVVRETHGWSYRQEAILSPTPFGWQTHLIWASIPSDDLSQRAETVKSELVDDVKSWTEADRARALGMAEAVLTRDVEFSPLYVLGSSPVGDSLEDRTFMAGYWQMKTGSPWNPAELLAYMKQVSLDDLKDQATSIVATSKARILSPG